ncbi:MAG: hypothetical protein M3142_14720, partial [Bacteroidota bacterium]|nr:hypothetical protein [Bacteroidota bacterium]
MKYNFTVLIILIFSLAFFIIKHKAFAQNEFPGSGNCLNLDGINDYLVAGKSNRGVTNKLTIEAWVKTTSLQLSWVAGKYSNSLGEDAGYEFFVTKGYAALYGRDGSGIYRFSGLSSTFVADNKWHHIAGIVNNGTWEIWVDGNLENKLETHYNNVNITTNQANFCIGTYEGYEDTYFKGNIDEVRVWNTVRTEKQIRESMCLKLTGMEPNLVGYFKFDESPNNTGFKDYSNSQFNAQLVNTNPVAVQELSGAPLGNTAVNFYKNTWNGSWASDFAELNEDNFLPFQITNVSGNVKGVHLYRIESTPNNLNSIIGKPNSFYYGIYTVSNNNQPVTFTINQKVDGSDDCYSLFKRETNATSNWVLLTTNYNQGASTLIKPNENYRGEYILSTSNLTQVIISGKTEICSGASTTLQAIANGVNKYLWSTGETTSSIQVKAAGTYSVKAFVTDQCFTEASVIVKANEISPVTISGGSAICPGSMINLQANGSNFTKFQWNTGETTNIIRVSNPGTYSVKAFTGDQCFSEASIIIKLVQPTAVTIKGDNKICSGTSTILLANANGVSRFLWNTGEATPSIQVSKPGIYSVKAFTTDQCYSETSIQIETLNGTNYDKVVAAGVSICPNNSATLIASGSNGTYQWFDAATSGNLIFEGATFTTPTLAKTTTFYVQSASQNQCSMGDRTPVTVQVGAVNAYAGRDTTIKEGSAVVLFGKGGVKYHWEPTSGLNNPNVERPIATPGKTTTYRVIAYSPEGCASSDEVTVTVIPRVVVVNTFTP